MVAKYGKCKLCERDDIKFAKSHIIPKSLWGTVLESGPARIISWQDDEPDKRSPKGEYDQSILCLDCEASLSPWDDYANYIFVESKPEPIYFDEHEPIAGQIANCDFFKLRMFFISLIWRMHTTHRKIFQHVDVGPHFELLKLALISEDPDMFPCLDVVITKYDHKHAEGIVSPVRVKWSGVNGYNVVFSQHSCWVKIDKRKVPDPFDELALLTGEPLYVFYMKYTDTPEFRMKVRLVRKKASASCPVYSQY